MRWRTINKDGEGEFEAEHQTKAAEDKRWSKNGRKRGRERERERKTETKRLLGNKEQSNTLSRALGGKESVQSGA